MDKIKAVYQIRNKINNKVYVGSSSNVKHRWHVHLYRLKQGKHHSEHLQNAWHKYGEENFVFEILEVVENTQELITKEQKWIDNTKCFDNENGYNTCIIAGSRAGVPVSENTKSKISLATAKDKHPFWGRTLTPQHKQRISESNKGKVAWNKGIPATEEEKQRMKEIRAKQINKPRSEETKNKISNTLMNHFVSDETKQKISESHTGKKLSTETKKKLSIANKGENAASAKLTAQQVEQIREMCYSKKYTQTQIAEMYSISQSTVSAIKHNKLWSK